MKRTALLTMALLLFLSGCGNTKKINGVTYDVYGIANTDEKRNPDIEYRVSIGSVIVSVIFFETAIVPIYVLLYDLWEPVGPKPKIKGEVTQ
ncbi:MAG: hypothetical protein KGL39_44930 [Patescibacteria group bacterium]|nr:hypothetical protein [Patescibacteria group bacterium]